MVEDFPQIIASEKKATKLNQIQQSVKKKTTHTQKKKTREIVLWNP